MSQVSRRILHQRLEKRLFNLFWKGFSHCRSTSQAELFLKDLFSPTEQVMLAKRLGIAIMLAKEYSYRNIADILKVSPPTIAKVNFCVKNSKGYYSVVNKLLHDETMDSITDSIKELLLDTAVPVNVGSAYEIKKILQKRLRTHKHSHSSL